MKNPVIVFCLYGIHRRMGVDRQRAISMAWRQA